MNDLAATPTALSPWTRLWRDLGAAGVTSLAAISFYISAASMMFQGPLASQLSVAIGAALLGGAVLAFVAAARASLPLASVGAEPSAAPILAAIAAGVAAETSGAALLPTTVAAIALTGLAIGGVGWLLGRRGWGDLIRYIPYPVIGGFLASIGWLLVVGGASVSTGAAFELRQAGAWLAQNADARLATGLGIGAVVAWAMRRARHPATLPALILAGAAAIHLALGLAGLDLAQARAAGWLLPALERTLPVWPGRPELLAAVQWSAVLHQSGLIFSAVVVSAIALLLSESSLEVAWDERADLNGDLRVFGAANLLAAGVGGLSGGLSISRSLLNRAAGASGRGSGFLKGALCVLVLIWGAPVIALLPRPLLGGLLVYTGLAMLQTWLSESRRMAPADAATLATIVVLTALFGFLPAVCFGVLACCLRFAVSSARLPPVRRRLSRAGWPERVERSARQAAHLRAQGGRLQIVELQGFLFFGSTTRLDAQLEALLATLPLPERLLFDFQHVHGLDGSAAQSLARSFRRVRRSAVAVAVSGLSASALAELRRADALPEAALVHADIDAAVAAWDEAELARAGLQDAGTGEPFGSAAIAAQTLPFMQTLQLEPGDTLFAQGDPSDALYVLRSGRLSAHVRQGDREVRVRDVCAGGTVGEMGLFRGSPRSATLRAEAQSVVLRLGEDRWAELQRANPALAVQLDRHFLGVMASRIDQLTAQAHELSR